MLKHGAVILTRMLILSMLLALAPLSNAMAQNAYELRQSWQTISELIAAQGRQTEAEQIAVSIRALSDQDLERIYQQQTLDDMISTLKDIQQAVNVVDGLNSNLSVQKYMDNRATFQAEPQMEAQAKPEVAGAFPDDLNYPNADYCPYSPERSDALALQIAVDAIQGARIALESAKVIWSGLSRACNQTAVVAGAGGNTSLACIPADVVLFAAELVVGAAEGVVEHFEFCDSGVDSAEIEGTWDGLNHVNAVLAGHLSQLSDHDSDIKYELELLNNEIDRIHAKLDEQKGMLETVISNQQQIIQLLNTPSGRRAEWNKTP